MITIKACSCTPTYGTLHVKQQSVFTELWNVGDSKTMILNCRSGMSISTAALLVFSMCKAHHGIAQNAPLPCTIAIRRLCRPR